MSNELASLQTAVSDACSESNQTSKMELLAKAASGFQALAIFAKGFFLYSYIYKCIVRTIT